MTPRSRLIAGIVALGSLMVMFDVTVTAIALPSLSTAFDAGLPTVQWVTTAYTLTLVAVMPISAWCIARLGDKRAYLLALTVFVAGSGLAAAAWNIDSLIAFRALQGMGGGLLAPIGMTVVMRSVDEEHRGRVMAIFGLPLFVGPVLGPTLGGVIVDSIGWRALFAINLPIGAAAILLALRYFPSSTPTVRAPLDVRGLLALSPGAALLVFAMTRIADAGRPTPLAIGAGIAAVVLIIYFARRSLAIPAPLLNLRLVSRRPMWSALTVLAPFTAAYFGSMLVLPVYVQQVRGGSATLAGTLTIGQALLSAIALQVGTRLADRMPIRPIVLTGISSALIGYAGLAWCVAVGADYRILAAVSLFIGLGAGATMMPLIATSTKRLPDADVPSGTTVLNTNSQLWSAIGAATVVTVMTLAKVDGITTGRSVAIAYLLPSGLAALALVVAAAMLPRRSPVVAAELKPRRTFRLAMSRPGSPQPRRCPE